MRIGEEDEINRRKRLVLLLQDIKEIYERIEGMTIPRRVTGVIRRRLIGLGLPIDDEFSIEFADDVLYHILGAFPASNVPGFAQLQIASEVLEDPMVQARQTAQDEADCQRLSNAMAPSQQPSPPKRTCRHCANQLMDDSVFCRKCGAARPKMERSLIRRTWVRGRGGEG